MVDDWQADWSTSSCIVAVWFENLVWRARGAQGGGVKDSDTSHAETQEMETLLRHGCRAHIFESQSMPPMQTSVPFLSQFVYTSTFLLP